jgi:hypothetical protein
LILGKIPGGGSGPTLFLCCKDQGGAIMRECEFVEQEKVIRLRAALEFLRDEAIRLDLDAVTSAIVRVLLIIRAQNQMSRTTSRLQ